MEGSLVQTGLFLLVAGQMPENRGLVTWSYFQALPGLPVCTSVEIRDEGGLGRAGMEQMVV